MNINKKFSNNIKVFTNFILTNNNKIFATSFFLFALIFATTAIIIFYCNTFYDFSNIAKDRLLNRTNTVYFITPLFFWVSSFLCKKLAFNPFGAGLDNITFALKKLQKKPKNYKFVANFIGLKIAFVIFISSLFSTIGGGSLGREAPSILISVCIFFSIAHFSRKYIISLPLENWIYVGYAVGLSVAFNAPIAGFIYLIEKLIKNKSKNYITSIFLSIIALITVYFLLKNHCTTYVIKNFKVLQFQDLFHYFIIALLCSCMALILLSTTRYLYINFLKINKFYWHFVPIFFGIIVAFCSLKYGIYSMGGGILSVNESLISDKIIYDYNQLIGRYFSTIFTYIAGNAGGLVAPSIALGNLIGNVYAIEFPNLEPKSLMLIGMTAFLSPVLGTPITSAIIIIESLKIDIANIFILVIISSLSFYLVLTFKKLGAKIRAKHFKPVAN
jgi:H+/Cl- antiporter ClcA